METTNSSSGWQVTQLTAVNAAKGFTVFCLLGLALVYGIHDQRQVLYLCLHISYCVWWLFEQWLFPQRRQQLFTEKIGWLTTLLILLVVGVFYALPGFLAFTNPYPITYTAIAVALPLYIFGSLINTGADVQKITAKQMGATLVSNEAWRSVRNINYLGDLMRYTSFSVVAGSAWAFVLPGAILLLYIQRIQQKEQAMAAKYPNFAEYQASSVRLLPWIW